MLGLPGPVSLRGHAVPTASLVRGSDDGLYSLLPTGGKGRGVAAFGPLFLPSSSSLPRPEPQRPHRNWDSSGASDVSRHWWWFLSSSGPSLWLLSAANCLLRGLHNIPDGSLLLPPPVWASCLQLPAALQLGERVGLFVAVISPSPGSSLTASRLRLHATQ